jgi:hypothetical protein
MENELQRYNLDQSKEMYLAYKQEVQNDPSLSQIEVIRRLLEATETFYIAMKIYEMFLYGDGRLKGLFTLTYGNYKNSGKINYLIDFISRTSIMARSISAIEQSSLEKIQEMGEKIEQQQNEYDQILKQKFAELDEEFAAKQKKIQDQTEEMQLYLEDTKTRKETAEAESGEGKSLEGAMAELAIREEKSHKQKKSKEKSEDEAESGGVEPASLPP